MAPAFFPRIFLATVAIVLIAGQRPASGQIRDAFEGGNPRWVLGRNDVNASVMVQQFVPGQARSGVSSELIELRCSQGSSLQLLYPIPPCAIIDELRASVWVRNAASGVTLGFRVVFPRTAHPLTGNQLSAVLVGAETSRGGQWSRIEVRDPLRLMQQKIALLRSEYGPSVDLRGAFVDAVVLNPYTGPGLIRLQLDDLEVDGNIELTAADRENDPGTSPMLTEDDRANDAALAQRLNDLQEGVPRWLQYRGESLSWLRTLGVTGVVVDTAKDQAWLKEARQLGIKVLMPPPNATPPRSEWASYEAVYGWLLGSALDHTHIEPTRSLRHRLAQFPAPLLRPTLAESMEQHWMFARVADVLAVPAPLPSSIRDGGEMIQLLKQSYDQTRGRTIPLTSLTIQPSPEYVEQTKGCSRRLVPDNKRQ